MSWGTFVINTLKPSNAELRSVIETALWKNFKNVQVTLATCPDLSKPPFRMTANGFGRKLSIAEVGGMGNLFPILHKDKDYDIKYFSCFHEIVVNLCGKKSAFVFGPCACPASVIGTTGALVADVNFTSSQIASKATIQQKGHTSPHKSLIIESPKFNLMANLAISEEPGPAEVEKWLHRFKVKAPLVCATVFHSYDPEFNLRMEHTHCYSDHDDG
ncbi:hypothetical protein TELCIR_07933, partial [Teladorsagia circumcincta]